MGLTMSSVQMLEHYRKAGDIIRALREMTPRIVRPGVRLVDICEKIEGEVRARGGKLAFPCNVGINDVAAHYTSPSADQSTVPSGSVVKVDFGAHVNGWIADSAVTVCLNPTMESMVVTAEEALREALSRVREGVHVSDIGATIQSAIERRGFRPIANLTGHVVDRYVVHTGLAIPNVSGMGDGKLREGQACAIEPFVTTRKAAGQVIDGRSAYIFRYVKKKGAKSVESKRLIEWIEREFRTLPFAKRWLQKFPAFPDVDAAFQELVQSRCLMAYPVLLEKSGAPVSQAEHTVLVTREGYECLTGSV